MKKEKEYLNFLKEIKKRIAYAQYEALRTVNKELINLYWNIGKRIVEKQKQLGWGKSVILNLSIDLQKEFPGVSGFSLANLWRIRDFYFIYSENLKLAPLVREVSWSKNILIMEKCKSDEQREFYLKQTKINNWTKNILMHQIENQIYEKYLLNQTNFDKTITTKIKTQSKFAVKDEYTLRDTNKPIGVSTYKIPEKIIKFLPTKEELDKIIKGDKRD